MSTEKETLELMTAPVRSGVNREEEEELTEHDDCAQHDEHERSQTDSHFRCLYESCFAKAT